MRRGPMASTRRPIPRPLLGQTPDTGRGRRGNAGDLPMSQVVSYERLLKTFWESHDPTQGMRQGNDVGTQYRSGIYVFTPEQRAAAEASKAAYAKALAAGRMGPITTEILDAPPFYFAEDYHQQYLAKNAHGYCGLAVPGCSCPIGTGVAA